MSKEGFLSRVVFIFLRPHGDSLQVNSVFCQALGPGTAPFGAIRVMSLLFKTLSRFVTVFLRRSKRLLISLLQPPSAVLLEPKKIKSVTSHFFPIDLP